MFSVEAQQQYMDYTLALLQLMSRFSVIRFTILDNFQLLQVLHMDYLLALALRPGSFLFTIISFGTSLFRQQAPERYTAYTRALLIRRHLMFLLIILYIYPLHLQVI